jgi:hypothetical protein
MSITDFFDANVQNEPVIKIKDEFQGGDGIKVGCFSDRLERSS